MKYLTLPIFLFFTLSLTAQNGCQSLGLEEGLVLKYVSLNKKDKEVGREVQEVISYEETDNGFDMEMSVTSYDKKDRELTSTYGARCEDGTFYVDVRNFMNDEMMSSLYGVEFTVEGTPLSIPSNLEVGQELPDGDVKISADGLGSLMNMTVTISDRKVTGKEKVKTEAGTFDCFVIEQTVYFKYLLKQTYMSRDYYSPDAPGGSVKSETMKKNGKVVSTRLLVGIEK